jgi:hypothetical protein
MIKRGVIGKYLPLRMGSDLPVAVSLAVSLFMVLGAIFKVSLR